MSGLSGVGIFWAFLSFLSSLSASIGFYMPYWLSGHMLDAGNTPVHFGVFRRCNYPAMKADGTLGTILECGRYTTFNDIPSISWKLATLTIGVGCGLAMLVSLTGILAVCIRGVVTPTVARTAGILQLCSGFLMGTGVGLYPNGWDSTEVQQSCGHTSKAYNMGECSLSWAFYLTAAGTGLTLICAVLSCHSPKRKDVVPAYRL